MLMLTRGLRPALIRLRLHVVYFPQIGYLICVADGERIDMPLDPTLEQQFASDE